MKGTWVKTCFEWVLFATVLKPSSVKSLHKEDNYESFEADPHKGYMCNWTVLTPEMAKEPIQIQIQIQIQICVMVAAYI